MSWKQLTEFFWVTAGVVLTALGLDLFLIPNKIAAGGVSGIATILHYVTGSPVGITMLALNVPLFIMGIYRLGLTFGFRSLYGTISLSAAVDFFELLVPVPTRDPLLASLFGGVLVGLGLGLVFRYRGTTGGTDLAAAIVRTYTGMNIGQLLFLVDASVVLAAGFVFHSWELALYALITIFVTAWVIDMVQEGISYAKAFFIISNRIDVIAEKVLNELGRGATALKARGLYTGMDREVILTVVNRSEVSRLKEIVYGVDPRAFIIVADVREVLGEGFKEWCRVLKG
ncbi:YitT family protein [Desulfallas sp. Bu1-1]|uniref:YitT family protein n=1 Tax=Desulfallas sp. Bu1-1 TaxID=2787620 RepID=UPI0018A0C66A|nr:YitT family protein [Desulfallas sp. Bu1-1]MBF7081640.1 YitT family protein [Desulfallas sp. Bu1-1]